LIHFYKRIGRGGISGWVKMWVCVGEEENRRGARGELEGRRRRRRGPNPFKADIIPRLQIVMDQSPTRAWPSS